MRQMRHTLITSEKLVKNRNARVDYHQKRRWHRNESEDKNTRSWKDYRKKQKHRINRAARSHEHHAPSASKQIKAERNRTASDAAQNVKQQKFIGTDFPFANRSENQKPEHIAEQMRPRAVHEHISENLPIEMPAHEQKRLQAVFHRHFVTAAAPRKNERKHIQHNQNYRGVIKTIFKRTTQYCHITRNPLEKML